MSRIDSIRYFLGIVPGSKSERIETVFAVAMLTIIVSITLIFALIRLNILIDTLGLQVALIDVALRLIGMLTIIALSIILYQYIATFLGFLIIWLICFPLELIISKVRRCDYKLSVNYIASPFHGPKRTSIIIAVPLIAPEDISPNTFEQAQAKSMMPTLLLPPPENYMFLAMLTEKCRDKQGLYNAFIAKDESTIKDSLDFAIKYWALVRLELIKDNEQRYLKAVPSKYSPVKRGQLSNLVKEVRRSIKEYNKAIKEGYEAEEKECEIYERYKVLKQRFKLFKEN